MKQLYFHLIVLIIITGSCTQPDNKATESPQTEIISIESTTLTAEDTSSQPAKTAVKVIVTNKSDYSEKFIKDLEKDYALGKKFILKDSLLIIDDHDTAYFSPTPKHGQVFVLKGTNEDLTITLTVK